MLDSAAGCNARQVGFCVFAGSRVQRAATESGRRRLALPQPAAVAVRRAVCPFCFFSGSSPGPGRAVPVFMAREVEAFNCAAPHLCRGTLETGSLVLRAAAVGADVSYGPSGTICSQIAAKTVLLPAKLDPAGFFLAPARHHFGYEEDGSNRKFLHREVPPHSV